MNRIRLPSGLSIHGQLIMWQEIIYLKYTTINLIFRKLYAENERDMEKNKSTRRKMTRTNKRIHD